MITQLDIVMFQFKQPSKFADDDEGFVDTSSNSNEHTPLISSEEEKKRKKYSKSNNNNNNNNNEKRVSFQREVSEQSSPSTDDARVDDNNHGRLHLAPLPPKTSTHSHKSRRTSKADDRTSKTTDDRTSKTTEDSSKKKSHSRHSHSRRTSKVRNDEPEKRSKSRLSNVKEQDSYV
jgi:hypothetical protein